MESHRLNLTWEANRFAQPQKAISRYQKIEADTIQFHIDFNLSTPNPLQKKNQTIPSIWYFSPASPIHLPTHSM